MSRPQKPAIIEKGFTFIELFVVLVIVGLVSMMAIPRLTGSIAGAQFNAAANRVAACLRYAHFRAVTEATPYAAVLDFSEQSLLIVALPRALQISDALGMIVNNAGRTQRNRIDLPAGVRWVAQSTEGLRIAQDRYAIVFYPLGNTSGASLALGGSGNRCCRLDVDPITGTIRVVAVSLLGRAVSTGRPIDRVSLRGGLGMVVT